MFLLSPLSSGEDVLVLLRVELLPPRLSFMGSARVLTTNVFICGVRGAWLGISCKQGAGLLNWGNRRSCRR